jgi:hypothetical protein
MGHPICRTVIAQFFERVWTNNRCSHPIMITRASAWPSAGVRPSAPSKDPRPAIDPLRPSARITNRVAACLGRRSRHSRSGPGARSMAARRTSAARSGVGGDERAVGVIPDRGHHPGAWASRKRRDHTPPARFCLRVLENATRLSSSTRGWPLGGAPTHRPTGPQPDQPHGASCGTSWVGPSRSRAKSAPALLIRS